MKYSLVFAALATAVLALPVVEERSSDYGFKPASVSHKPSSSSTHKARNAVKADKVDSFEAPKSPLDFSTIEKLTQIARDLPVGEASPVDNIFGGQEGLPVDAKQRVGALGIPVVGGALQGGAPGIGI